MFKMNGDALQIMKVDVPKLNVNIMDDMQQSYRKYLEETIYEDMKFLEETIQSYPGNCSNATLKVEVGDLVKQTYTVTQTSQGKYFYPVTGTLYIDGHPIGKDMEIVRIPYMNDYGQLNIDGSSKVVLSVLRSSEDISYTLKDNTFNIAMPYANIKIQQTKKGINVRYGKSQIPIDLIISAMLANINDSTNVYNIFANTRILNGLKVTPKTLNRYSAMSLKNSSDILTKYASTQYKLGDTRLALNSTLTIDRALGCTLSREVEGFPQYPEGTTITQQMIKEFKFARVNTLYVQHFQMLTGYTITSEAPIIVTEIPAGTKNCSLLRKIIPQFTGYAEIPEDVKLSEQDYIVIANNVPLTEDLAEFLLIFGFKSIDVHAGKSKKVIKFSFEREICGNYTAQLKDLTNNPPPGRSADEWVYFYNNPNLDRTDVTDWLTPHDLIAIASLMGEIAITGNTSLLNRDTSFLKKTLMVNEIFSETLRQTITEFFKTHKAVILNQLTQATGSNPFANLTLKWVSRMNSARYLSPIDSINLTSEISQVNHVTNLMSSSAEVVDEMRHLAMPFYGRICPFETPAGKKLGLVNTKAIGTRIKDGLMLAPYRKVLPTANGIRISNKITWLSVKQELGCKFGDMLSLERDPNNPEQFLNKPILARIPNPDISDEPFIFATINSFDLAGGYVDAYPEQFLSPTAAMVPFVCSNNAVRISYGVSQIRQAIYLLNSQRPRVRTEMYEDIFKYSESLNYCAPCAGRVLSIDNISAVISGIDGCEHTVYMQNSNHQGQLDATVELLVRAGETVKEGQVLGTAHMYPQPFVVRAPYDGKVIEVTDEYIQLDKNIHSSGVFVDLNNTDTIAINNGRIMGQTAVFLNIHVAVGDIVHKGDILADTCMSRGGVYSPARNPLVAYISSAYNYEDGVHAFERGSVGYTSMSAHKVDVKLSKRHNKFSRAESIQGFKYCGAGDVIGTIKLKETANSKNATTHKVKATLKANGIPYEFKTIDDNNTSKTYRYHLLSFNKLQAGDKMSGCHGNKGVVSVVQPDSLAPQLSNGRTVEFLLNPCGVPSRMNLGQIWHAHLGLIAEVLGIEIISNSYNGASPWDIEYLMDYAWNLANTIAIGDNVTKTYNRNVFDMVCAKYDKLPKELHDKVWSNIDNVIDWRGVFDKNGDAILYDPETDTYYENPITIGCPTFLKLMQEADEKLNVRAGVLEEQYSRTNSQPQKGDNSAKGQRMAEMELMSLAAYGSANFIDEILNEKSDNAGRMINNHLQQLGINIHLPDYCCESRAVTNLLYMLEAVGVKAEVPSDVADTSHFLSVNKHVLNLPKLLNQQFSSKSRKYKSNTDMLTVFDNVED